MLAVLAAVPIVVVLVAMVGLGRPAAQAGLGGAAVALVLGFVAFDLGSGIPGGAAGALVGIAAESAFVTLTVVAIVAPALAVHHLQQRTGATGALRGALARAFPDPRVGALLVAWFFALFMEGAAGFGTPVALAAPFLVAAGFTPLTAVTAALFGHAAGVSFGALGTPVVAQAAASGFGAAELAAATAPYHATLGWALAAAVVVMIGRALPDLAAPWGWGAVAAVAFFVPYWALARFVGPELPTLGGALVGAALFTAAVRAARPRPTGAAPLPGRDAPSSSSGLLRATAPYLALVVVVLATRMVPPVEEALGTVVVEWRLLEQFTGSVRPLLHPGLLLPLAFAAGALVQRASWSDVRAVAATTNRQLVPVVVALVAMVAIARTMSHAGMTLELAGAAAGAGAAWPLLSPVVGALGTFVTGSATASNILFTELQEATAAAVGRPALPLLGAQSFGAAAGNIICPHNVVAAAATVGMSGGEGAVLRRTLPVTGAYVLAGGLLAWWWRAASG